MTPLLPLSTLFPLLLPLLGAAFATLGFAVAINVPRRCLPFAIVVGVAGQAASLLMRAQGATDELASLVGGATVGLLAELGARLLRAPVTVFTITGFIPLVPGTMAFRAITQWLNGEYILGMALALRTILIGGAIAAGLGLSTAVFQLRRRP
jgi:uncharacterized membrane protein YjjB (DUF3815 family)